MPASPILFMDDRSHLSVTATVRTASSTASGYAISNSREADLVKAHKHVDGTADEYLMDDGGSTTWLGATGATMWLLLAFDPRGADQAAFRIRTDAADNPAGTFATPQGTIFIDVGKAGVICEMLQLSVPSPAKRYWRLIQLNADRSAATKCAKVLYWAMAEEAGTIRVDGVGYLQDSQAEYSIRQMDRQGIVRTTAGNIFTNRYAAPGQAFELSLGPATLTLWQALRDKFRANGGVGRAIFCQFEGLANPGVSSSSNFFLCRRTAEQWSSSLEFADNYNAKIEFETEPWR